MRPNEGYVELAEFGQDHWSTLAYAETVMMDHAGFQVGFDGSMRQGRRNYRIMKEQCSRPKRNRPSMGVVMDVKYSTRLRNDEQVAGHDDWHCIQDMISAELMGVVDGSKPNGVDVSVDRMEPGVTLTLTPRGWDIAQQLRRHKAAGGRWKDFVPTE